MQLFWIIAWIQKHDPYGYMTQVQRLMVESALMRDDVKTAKQYMLDWKIPTSCAS